MFRVLKKNQLIETVLLSIHNICLSWKIRKTIFIYTLLATDQQKALKHDCIYNIDMLLILKFWQTHMFKPQLAHFMHSASIFWNRKT